MRNKKLRAIAVLSSLSLLLFTGCGKDNGQLLKDSLVDISGEDIGTATVDYGDLKLEQTFSGEAYYPIRNDLTSPVSGCALKEIVVKRNDTVKQGDLIATVEAVSPQQLQEKQDQIQKKRTDLENARANAQREIQSLQQTADTTSDPNQRQICLLRIQEQQLLMEHTETEYGEDLAKMEEELQQIQAAASVDGIYAPFDGIIDSVNPIPEGTILTADRSLGTIYSSKTILIRAKNPGDISYGQTAQVTAGVGKSRSQYTGTVVGADNALPDAIQNGELYIRLDEPVDPKLLTNIEVTAVGYHVEHVLMVKSSAIFEQKGQQYVYLLQDGELMQRHVITGGSDGTNTWILRGLSQGDVVSIQ